MKKKHPVGLRAITVPLFQWEIDELKAHYTQAHGYGASTEGDLWIWASKVLMRTIEAENKAALDRENKQQPPH